MQTPYMRLHFQSECGLWLRTILRTHPVRIATPAGLMTDARFCATARSCHQSTRLYEASMHDVRSVYLGAIVQLEIGQT